MAYNLGWLANNSLQSSFSTSFATDETTLGSPWARLTGPQPDSGSDHSGWHDVSAVGGNAVPRFNSGPTGGGPGSGDYDDCYSLLTGNWAVGTEVAVGQIYIGAGAREIELLFRGSDTAGSPGTVTLYELLFNPADALYEAVRWNGNPDDFTSLRLEPGPTLSNDDWIRGTVSGLGGTVSILMEYALAATPNSWNPLLSTTDTAGNRRLSGRPGIGFFSRTGNSLDYGLKSYSITVT